MQNIRNFQDAEKFLETIDLSEHVKIIAYHAYKQLQLEVASNMPSTGEQNNVKQCIVTLFAVNYGVTAQELRQKVYDTIEHQKQEVGNINFETIEKMKKDVKKFYDVYSQGQKSGFRNINLEKHYNQKEIEDADKYVSTLIDIDDLESAEKFVKMKEQLVWMAQKGWKPGFYVDKYGETPGMFIDDFENTVGKWDFVSKNTKNNDDKNVCHVEIELDTGQMSVEITV